MTRGVAALLVVVAGCSAEDTVARRLCAEGAECDDRDAYCAGSGPPVLVGDGRGGANICAGDLAEQSFRHAVCACSDLDNATSLTADAFDSATGPYMAGGAGGSIASNGKIQVAGPLISSGDVIAGGSVGVAIDTQLSVAGDLVSAGPLGFPSARVEVGGDARVAGDVTVTDLTVGGTLSLPADAALEVPGALALGATRREAVTVEPPCACNSTDQVDIGGIVEAHRVVNHNAAIGLAPDQLADFFDAQRLELPCGRFHLQRVQGRGDLTIVANGRVALFVGQSVTLDRDLTVELAEGAELDLFIAGYVNTSGAVRLGSVADPSKLRVYVGGAGAIAWSATSTLAGNLYAPLSDMALSAGATVFGALFVNRLLSAAPVELHYDRAVQSAGAACR